MRRTSKTLRAGRIAPWTRSPLMRRADRFEQSLRLTLLFAALAGIAVAVLVGMSQYHAESARIRAVNATKTSVAAVITAEPVRLPAAPGMYVDQMRAEAAWTAGGHPGRAMVDVTENARRGDHISVWLDPHGAPTTPPLSVDAAVAKGSAIGMGALLAVWTLAYATSRCAALGLDHRRAAGWEREWRRISPTVGI